MTKFLLDSGDPNEYKEIAELAKAHNAELWGSTTNPSLIAKKLAGKKVSQSEALQLQKEIVMEIVSIVPGAVSAEVYADAATTAEQMIEQGKDIATWHERVVVKLPTTKEGFKARTALRQAGITVNNTLVFSQEQIFAICLHERLIEQTYHLHHKFYPPFISPFLGRLDDQGKDGLSLVENGIKIQELFFDENQTWMLAASIRNIYHFKHTLENNCDLITAPAKIYKEWFLLTDEQKAAISPAIPNLKPISYWEPLPELLSITSITSFMEAISSGYLNIHHELTDKGIEKFTADWQTIING